MFTDLLDCFEIIRTKEEGGNGTENCTAATVERAHSALKLVKADIRSAIVEGRRNAFMLL